MALAGSSTTQWQSNSAHSKKPQLASPLPAVLTHCRKCLCHPHQLLHMKPMLADMEETHRPNPGAVASLAVRLKHPAMIGEQQFECLPTYQDT